MNLGGLTTLARYRPRNLVHVVFDNESLLSVGGFPTATSAGTDLAAVAALNGAVRRGRVTLLFGARDERHNNAVALGQYLTGQAATPGRGVITPSGTAETESGSRATTDR